MAIFPASQNKRRALLRVLLLLCGAAVFVLALAQRPSGFAFDGALIAVAIVMGVLATLQFFTLDEAQKRSHYVAWYWGATFSSLIVVGLYFGLFFDVIAFEPIARGLAHTRSGAGAEGAFLAGLITTPFLFAIGFAVWQCVDWLRQRF